MIQAIIYGFLNGFALLLGVIIGNIFKLKQKTIASFMAFGSGVLICALTFGLMQESFQHGGFDAAIIGFISGGAVFIIGDYFLHVVGARKHKRKPLLQSEKDTNGQLITFGAMLDGIPESVALGISIFNGLGTGILMLAAIFLSNFPEGISSLTGLRKEKFSTKQIYGIWIAVGLAMMVIFIC